jgi:hypothetical protein
MSSCDFSEYRLLLVTISLLGIAGILRASGK